MASETDAANEVERIRQAYERYGSDARELRRRDPLNPGLLRLRAEWRARLGARLASRDLPTAQTRVLDIGCGDGSLLAWFVAQGAEQSKCHGIDLMPERVAAAQERLPDSTIECGDASQLPWGDASMDVLAMSMVISTVLDDRVATGLCDEASRVTTPGGVIVWYDTRIPNPRNREVRAIRARDIRRLFPGYEVEAESITLVPPLARALPPRLAWLHTALARAAFLRTRYLAILVKGSSHGVIST
jgi:SAM-dependent methyltransferase